MKSIMLELIPIDPGMDQLLVELKSNYQIVPDGKIIHRIKNDSIQNIADGQEYRIFDNSQWLITGKIDDEDLGSIWIEIFKK
jgi:hypothetical protein